MKTLTGNELVNMLSTEVRGTSIVTILSETEPEMRKTGNPFADKGIVKVQFLNGVIGYDYENAINKLAEKEGKAEREAKPRKWGVLTEDRIFVTHKGNWYLRMKVEKSTGKRYIDSDGNEVDETLLKPFLVVQSSKSSSQSDLEGKVIERDVKIGHVKTIAFKGETYAIMPSATIEIKAETIPIPAPVLAPTL